MKNRVDVRRRRPFIPRAAAVAAILVAGSAGAHAEAAGGSGKIVVTPLTTAGSKPPRGYYSDPFPVTLPPALAALHVQVFSGTTPSFLVCPPTIDANCAELGPVTLRGGAVAAQAEALGSKLHVSDNFNVFIDKNGKWHMIATVYVNHADAPAGSKGWTVLVHAHPVDPALPTNWVADTLLVGSLAKDVPANYDGKLFDVDGALYMIYSSNLSENPRHDGLVAQRMISPSELAPDKPVLLLQPKPGAGFASEIFDETGPADGFKLVETGNIAVIDGKYALAYSTGAFNQPDYKIGVAWSDTFLPTPGHTYRKVLRADPDGVWGTPGATEVQYLLQAEKPAWPNNIATEVVAPGVPSFIKGEDGSYRVFFAGYDPSDDPTNKQTGNLISRYRRPYAVRLRVNIPAGATVAGASDAALATWLLPVTQQAALP